MRFFNIDLHVAVIEDVGSLFGEVGHEVVSHNMSGHAWVFGRQSAGYFGPLSPENHAGISADEFYAYAKDQLAEYDGFICCYPPAYAMMYERFRKPIILQVPVRYEYPFHNRPADWLAWNEFLHRASADGLLFASANNLYDRRYFTHFTGLNCEDIPSVCDHSELSYGPQDDRVLIMQCTSPEAVAACEKETGAISVRRLYGIYRWEDLVKHKAFVWLPYNCSVMSLFEHYAWGVPIFAPSLRFLAELQERYNLVDQLTWNGFFSTSPNSVVPAASPDTDVPDPNNHKDLSAFRWWAPLFDIYRLPHIRYFESWGDLRERLRQTDLSLVSAEMRAAQERRKAYSLGAWRKLLGRLPQPS